MIVTVFRARLNPEHADEYFARATQMSERAKTMPGYISHKSLSKISEAGCKSAEFGRLSPRFSLRRMTMRLKSGINSAQIIDFSLRLGDSRQALRFLLLKTVSASPSSSSKTKPGNRAGDRTMSTDAPKRVGAKPFIRSTNYKCAR